MDLAFHWQACRGGARLLRVYGDTPCPVIPAALGGVPVAEIGAYCFSATVPDMPGDGSLQYYGDKAAAAHAICGGFLQRVSLPAGITTLHNAAFYNCRALAGVSAGAALCAVGSNVFTNCRSLQCFTLHCAPSAATGLKKLLACVSEDIYAEFCPDGASAPAARLFYPDYLEFMDESAPAHLFILNIEGEGYRYRQCFNGGVLSFAQYDAAFAHAAEGETPQALCQVALCRLLYPYALQPQARAEYSGYLHAHFGDAVAAIITARDEAALRLLCALPPSPEARRDAALRCSTAGWSEGAALLLGGEGKKRKKTYDFD